ncbi:MAG: hypothetical protein J7539_02495 [Niabella sp.]|nr:hypothetical protein [Niabella sp.]
MNRQHKLYDYQVTPPAGAWERIAGSLEELQSFSSVSGKLLNAEAAPPADAWKQLAASLDELEQLAPVARKLENIEVPPPAAAWDAIVEQLDSANDFNQLSEKLQHLAIEPPAALWSRIEPELPVKAVARAKTVSFKWARYAVAASVVGLLCFATIHLLEKSAKGKGTGLAVLHTNEKKDNTQVAVTLPKDTNTTPQNEEETDSAEEAAPLLAQQDKTPGQPTQIMTATGHTYHTTIEKNKALQGRYIMLMTEDGNVVRMSKKLGNIADCVSGETDGSECTNQIQEWQKEVANAPVTATPDTFLDLLNLASAD